MRQGRHKPLPPDAPISDIVVDAPIPPEPAAPAVRETFVWNGATLYKKFVQTPRIHHLPAAKAQSGDKRSFCDGRGDT